MAQSSSSSVAPTELSCAVSGIMSVLVFAAMQIMQESLKSSEMGTIAGGLMGSILFLFLITFINNLENMIFDKGFKSNLVPEVFIAILMAVFACALVHRVCATTCIIFSIIVLYYLNNISVKKYGVVPSHLAHTSHMSGSGKNKRKN